MSKVAIKGNTSGTGTFTVEAPNSNTDRTLVLPDEAGTVLTSASDVLTSTSDLSVSNIESGQVTAKAWVLFKGDGTAAIQNSYNAAGLTDNGTGDYTIEWDNDFSSRDYCVVATACRTYSVSGNNNACVNTNNHQVGSINIVTFYADSGSLVDWQRVSVVAFRG